VRWEARQPASRTNCLGKSEEGGKHKGENTSTKSTSNYESTCRNPVQSPETKPGASDTWLTSFRRTPARFPASTCHCGEARRCVACIPPRAARAPAALTLLTLRWADRDPLCSAGINRLRLLGIQQLLGLSAKPRLIVFKTFLNFTCFCSAKGTGFTIALFPIQGLSPSVRSHRSKLTAST